MVNVNSACSMKVNSHSFDLHLNTYDVKTKAEFHPNFLMREAMRRQSRVETRTSKWNRTKQHDSLDDL